MNSEIYFELNTKRHSSNDVIVCNFLVMNYDNFKIDFLVLKVSQGYLH